MEETQAELKINLMELTRTYLLFGSGDRYISIFWKGWKNGSSSWDWHIGEYIKAHNADPEILHHLYIHLKSMKIKSKTRRLISRKMTNIWLKKI